MLNHKDCRAAWPLIAGLVVWSLSIRLQINVSINTSIINEDLRLAIYFERLTVWRKQRMHNATVTFQQVIWCLSRCQMVTSSVTSVSPSGRVCVDPHLCVCGCDHRDTNTHALVGDLTPLQMVCNGLFTMCCSAWIGFPVQITDPWPLTSIPDHTRRLRL